MTLRRAMGVAAATAVLAPLALLSAPTAFADDPTTTSAGPSDTPSDTASAAPTDTVSAAPTDTGVPTGTAPAPTDPTSSTTAPSGTPSQSTTPEPPEPSESADPSEDPTDPDVPFCEDVDKDYAGAKVSAAIKGLPGKIVAGDGFHAFELTVTNDAKTTVEDVAFYAEVENYEVDEAKFLSPYVDLQFKHPESGSWDRIGTDARAGAYVFYADKLKAGQSRTVDLRVAISSKAPAGDAYSFGSGAYLDSVDGQDCIAEGWAQYDFEVLKAGSANPAPGSATPGDNGGKASVKKPQGEISDLPTGNLADTGSSSALPVIGLVGGVAVVAGAGAVFAVRRRKAGPNA